ncbi:MAG: hypothetical protein OXI71_09925 [Gemmatimonadota bacterium]|nr:hypothetical protein [Gemmatimonadota bacterium]
MVPAEVSLHHAQVELQRAASIVELFDLDVDASMLSESDLRIRVTGASCVDEEEYVVEMLFDGYRAIPPFVEFLDPDTGEAGTPAAYPSCFHTYPCICAVFNRKTYGQHSGLHKEWQYEDWTTNPATEDIGGILNHVYASINNHFGNYAGRQG